MGIWSQPNPFYNYHYLAVRAKISVELVIDIFVWPEAGLSNTRRRPLVIDNARGCKCLQPFSSTSRARNAKLCKNGLKSTLNIKSNFSNFPNKYFHKISYIVHFVSLPPW